MAIKDYEKKNGTAPFKAEAVKDDAWLHITLTDANGKELDVYQIEPVSGIGTNQTGNQVNLPQTGYFGFQTIAEALAALLTLTGLGMIFKSRKRKHQG